MILGLLLAVILLYAGAVVGAAWLSVHPRRLPHVLHPGAFDLPAERVDIEGEAGLLKSWFVPAPAGVPRRGGVVFCHGYYLNRSEFVPEAWRLHHLGFDCLLFDFRAFGSSQGNVTTVGWAERADVLACVIDLRERVGGPIGVYGSSMGSAAAAYAMGEQPQAIDWAILDSCYGRIDRSVGGWWRFVGGKWLSLLLAPVLPLAGFLADLNPRLHDVAERVAGYEGPVLILHGTSDDLAHPDEARRILAALPNGEIRWFDGAEHSAARWTQPQEYADAVTGFLARIAPPGRP